MRRVRVKICGMTKEEDLAVALDCGVDAVGFIVGVPSTPRNISMERAERMIGLVPVFAKSVLVTVPTNVDELVRMCEKLKPNAIQIHGENPPDHSIIRERLPNTPLIRAVNANPTNAFDKALEASKSFDAILLDSFVQGMYGGTGVVHDWELSKRIKKAIYPKPLILAGGLKPGNVGEAIRSIEPYAVDVSSGVELQPGVKDHGKIEEFIKNAKEVRI
jgi:phosphoribosylanthranilate isomerase